MAATNSKARDSGQRGARGQMLSRVDKWHSYRQHHQRHSEKQHR